LSLCEVFVCYIDSFAKARAIAKYATETSNVESMDEDDDEEGQRIRIPNKRYHTSTETEDADGKMHFFIS